MLRINVPNTTGGIMQVRRFPGGWCLKLNIFLNVLVTLRPKISGRLSSVSVGLSFVELDAVVIFHSCSTEKVQRRSDGKVNLSV